MQARPGTYALVLRSPSKATVRVGRLGCIALDPGYYVYVGSAFGPGGVRARVSRHFREQKPRHWHLDYLRDCTRPVGAWYSHDSRRLEHAWAQSLAALPGLSAIANFGCSDCSCQSHLFYTTARPALNATPGIDDGDLKWVAYRGGETLQPSNR
jgi:Uri superfamily endonuclease